MKKIYFVAFLICIAFQGFSTTWYSVGSGNADDLNSWWSISGGTGSNPITFSTPGDTFIMQSSLVSTPGISWTIAGSLYISNVTFIPEYTSMNIGGDFNLNGGAYMPANSNLTINIGGNLMVIDSAVLDNPYFYSFIHFVNSASTFATPQTITWTSIYNSLYTDLTVDPGVTVQLASNLQLSNSAENSSFLASGMTVNGTLVCGTWVVSDPAHTDVFTTNPGSTLYTANTNGLDGTSTVAVNSFSGGANYTFNGSAAQVTGTSFPTDIVSPGSLTVSNTSGLTLSQSTLIDAGANLNMGSGNLVIGSNTLTINGTVTGMSVSNVFTGGPSSALSIGNTSAIGSLFMDQTSDGVSNNLATFTLNFSGFGALALGNNLYCNSLLLVSGQLMLNGQTLTINGGFAMDPINNLSCAGGSMLNIGGAGTTGTLYFDQSVPGLTNALSGFTLNSAGGNISLGTDVAVNGNLNLTNGTISDGGYTLSLAGNITGTGTHISVSSGEIYMDQAGATISGATLGNLELDNPLGFGLSGNASLTGMLILTSGNLSLGSNNMNLSVASTISGTFSNTSMIIANGSGMLQKQLTSNGSFLFPIGDNLSNYTPIIINMMSGSYSLGAYVAANVTASKHPANANTNNYLNRYWSISTSGIIAPEWSVTSATYVPGDVTGTEANISMGEYYGGLPWVKYGPTNTTTHSLTAGFVVTALGDFTGISTAGPNAVSSPNSGLCIGSSATLTASGTTGDPGLTYTWAPATALSATTGISVMASPLTNTTYTLTVTDGNGFSSTTTTAYTINYLPTVYTISGGGPYCSSGSGVSIGLANSDSGLRYMLYHALAYTGSNIAGTGSAVSFGLQSLPGSYTIVAENPATGCTSNMTGSADVTLNPLPELYYVFGGGYYCSGGSGVDVGLSYTNPGISYQLYVGTTLTGSPIPGAGSAIDFGLQATPGEYWVKATDSATGCTSLMIDSVSVVMNALPNVYTVTGGGDYCAGGAGKHVGLSYADSGIHYQLFYMGGLSGSFVAGSNAPLDFGLETGVGTYTATGFDPATACTSNMVSLATISTITLPAAFHMTGGGSYCSGGSGVNIGLDNSASGVNYQLFYGTMAIGSYLSGTTDSILNFGPVTGAGTYKVIATDTTTGCTNTMADSETVAINPLLTPSVNILSSGADTLCAGTLVHFTLATTNSGTSPLYQWKVNGSIVDTLHPAYSYTPADGDVVSIKLRSNATCASPDSAMNAMTMLVWVNGMPSVTVANNKGGVLCQGDSVTFTAAPVFGGPSPFYIWVINGYSVVGGPTYIYTPSNGDIVYCSMMSDYLCRTDTLAVSSSNTILTVDSPIVPSVVINSSAGPMVGLGLADTLTAVVTNGGTSPLYQWVLNNSPITAATSSTYFSSGFSNHDSVTCMVTRNDACSLSSYNSIILDVAKLGIKSFTGAGNIAVMPNPNKGTFEIIGSFSSADGPLTLEITNMLGQQVYSGIVNVKNGLINEKVELGNSPSSGVYLLNLHSGNENVVFRMVIEH